MDILNFLAPMFLRLINVRRCTKSSAFFDDPTRCGNIFADSEQHRLTFLFRNEKGNLTEQKVTIVWRPTLRKF